ncbi:MAG: hypothetical protein ACI857_001654 [Arenicella sp.]|jgi:hypothetical protein
MKPIFKILPFLILGFTSCNSENTNSDNCNIQEIKYLSTYIDSRMYDVAGGNAEIDLKTAQEMCNMDREMLKEARHLIPMLLQDVGMYFSDSILETHEKLLISEFSKIFSKIWKDETLVIESDATELEYCEKTDLIIDKYHEFSENDSEFYKMIYTLDDGPFFGIDTDSMYSKIEEIALDEKTLILRGNGTENTLEVTNQSDELIWRKIIARSSDYIIHTLEFADKPIRVNNKLGYKIALYGDGELVQLYLKKNGSFRLFFHSW